jgi:two-component system chemotaxis sensor kinase CheA
VVLASTESAADIEAVMWFIVEPEQLKIVAVAAEPAPEVEATVQEPEPELESGPAEAAPV